MSVSRREDDNMSGVRRLVARAGVVVALVAGTLGATGGVAHAATSVYVIEGDGFTAPELTVTGGSMADSIIVRYAGECGYYTCYTVENTKDTVSAGEGCTSITAHLVRCAIRAWAIDFQQVPIPPYAFELSANTGGGNDYFALRTAVEGRALAVDTLIDGGDGADTLDIDGATPSLYTDAPGVISGGAGNDTIQLRTVASNLELGGGTGTDFVSFFYARCNAAPHGVTVDLDGQRDDGCRAQTAENLDRLNVLGDVEDIGGSQGPDIIAGSNGANRINGYGGADDIIGGLGYDTVSYISHNVSVTVTIDDVANDGAAVRATTSTPTSKRSRVASSPTRSSAARATTASTATWATTSSRAGPATTCWCTAQAPTPTRAAPALTS
jgi:Ca2+-binding RTX toxin-like protein